jgi:hypothetical protein
MKVEHGHDLRVVCSVYAFPAQRRVQYQGRRNLLFSCYYGTGAELGLSLSYKLCFRTTCWKRLDIKSCRKGSLEKNILLESYYWRFTANTTIGLIMYYITMTNLKRYLNVFCDSILQICYIVFKLHTLFYVTLGYLTCFISNWNHGIYKDKVNVKLSSYVTALCCNALVSCWIVDTIF